MHSCQCVSGGQSDTTLCKVYTYTEVHSTVYLVDDTMLSYRRRFLLVLNFVHEWQAPTVLFLSFKASTMASVSFTTALPACLKAGAPAAAPPSRARLVTRAQVRQTACACSCFSRSTMIR